MSFLKSNGGTTGMKKTGMPRLGLGTSMRKTKSLSGGKHYMGRDRSSISNPSVLLGTDKKLANARRQLEINPGPVGSKKPHKGHILFGLGGGVSGIEPKPVVRKRTAKEY